MQAFEVLARLCSQRGGRNTIFFLSKIIEVVRIFEVIKKAVAYNLYMH